MLILQTNPLFAQVTWKAADYSGCKAVFVTQRKDFDPKPAAGYILEELTQVLVDTVFVDLDSRQILACVKFRAICEVLANELAERNHKVLLWGSEVRRSAAKQSGRMSAVGYRWARSDLTLAR